MKKLFLGTFMLLVSAASFAQYTAAQVSNLYHAKQPSLSSADLDNLLITDQYTSRHNGVTHIYMRQRVNGIEIFNANSSIHLDKEGHVLKLNHAFVQDARSLAGSSKPGIQAASALSYAGSHIGMPVAPVLEKSITAAPGGAYTFKISESPEPAQAKLYYLLTDADTLKLIWNVELLDKDNNDWWNMHVDAASGEVLEQHNHVIKCSVAPHAYERDFSSLGAEKTMQTENVQQLNKKQSTSTYNVFALPLESPLYGTRSLVSDPARLTASPYGWHDTDGVAGADATITKGNNAWAYEDHANLDAPGHSPDGGANHNFDFYFSDAGSPDSNLDAAITNMFYWNNLNHDIFYQYGFDEAAGNYQVNNYGKGGTAGDPVMAEAQDGSGLSNANFTSLPDGQPGKMQMYIWPSSGAGNNFKVLNGPSAGTYTVPVSTFGPGIFSQKLGQLVLANDSTASPTLGCSPLKNNVAGKIVLIDRGTCGYAAKVQNAQNAGAIAVIIINTSTQVFSPSATSSTISIPSAMIGSTTGAALKALLQKDSVMQASLDAYNTASTAIYDSDFDNGVITHEFGHGISIRLTGGPANANCLNNREQEGEGWSDFFCLALTAKQGDNGDAGRGIGNWVMNQGAGAVGIRTFKYSRSMSICPATYSDIKLNSDVHYTGSIWCAMLWDIFWDMVDKYGYDADIYNGHGGNNKAIQLVIDGLKLQPCSPGFIDSRNAILAADSIDNGGANYGLIWKAFARRGLGWGASQGSSNSITDGVEAFDIPPTLWNTGISNVNALANIRMVPNPSTGVVNLNLPKGAPASLSIDVYDLTGKLVHHSDAASGSGSIRLDLSALNNGMYLVKASSGNDVFQSRLVISQ